MVTIPEGETRVGVVTESHLKVRGFKTLFPADQVFRIPPNYVESDIHGVTHGLVRAMQMSLEKARFDLATDTGISGGMLEIFRRFTAHNQAELPQGELGRNYIFWNDVVQFLPDQGFVMERPKSYEEWLYQAVSQSGRRINICAGHTAMYLGANYPQHTVGVLTEFRARDFTKDQARKLASKVGIENMMGASGGLPLAHARSLMRTDMPLVVKWYPDVDEQESLPVLDLPHWHDVKGKLLTQCVTGAFPEPVHFLVNQLQQPGYLM